MGSGLIQPWLLLFVAAFIGFYSVRMLQGQTDFIQTIEKTMFAVFGDLEIVMMTAGCGNGLFGQIDAELIAFMRSNFMKKLIHYFFGQNYR